MWFNGISFIAALLVNAPVFAAATPKAPQSPTPSAEVEKTVSAKSRSTGNSTQNSKITSLGEISTEVESDLTIVTARLNKIPEWKDVVLEEHGTFLQIKMPRTQIPASGEFIDGNGPYLRKLATFQLAEEDGALRLFLNQDAAKAKLATTAELLGDRLIITIDHKKLEQLIAPQQSKSESATASDIISKTTVEKSVPAPGDLITKEATEPKTEKSPIIPASQQIDLNSQLTKVAGFCGLLFLGLLAAQWTRVRRRKNSGFTMNGETVEPAAMRILSNMTIGQKQKLTLVQIGHQQLLLGVCPESINLLTTIEPRNKTTSFAKHLDTPNSNTEIRLKSPDEIVPPRPQRRPLAASTIAPRNDVPVKGGRINVGIGEDGPKNMNASNHKKDDDITKILRDRLRNLPPG